MITDVLHRLANHRQSLARDEARAVMTEVLTGQCTEAQIAALLVALHMKGETVEEIARARGFVPSTIYSHLLAAIECGKLVERDRFFTPAQEAEIAAAFRQIADGTLIDVSALLGNKYDIGELRIFRVFATRSRVQRRR